MIIESDAKTIQNKSKTNEIQTVLKYKFYFHKVWRN